MNQTGFKQHFSAHYLILFYFFLHSHWLQRGDNAVSHQRLFRNLCTMLMHVIVLLLTGINPSPMGGISQRFPPPLIFWEIAMHHVSNFPNSPLLSETRQSV